MIQELEAAVHFVGRLASAGYALPASPHVASLFCRAYTNAGVPWCWKPWPLGKPVIATRWGGPTDYLDSTCGILVEPESYIRLRTGFAEGIGVRG